MQSFIKYPFVFLAAFAVTLLLTPLWIRVARRLNFMDAPAGRKRHANAVPTSGGIAVIFGFHASCALVFLFPWAPFAGMITQSWWLRFAVLTAGLAVVGLLDDRYPMRPYHKLAGQVLVALAAYALGIRMQNVLGFYMPAWVDVLLTTVFFLLMMNAFNLIDGLDGVAAGIGVIAAAGIGLALFFRRSPGDVLLFLALAGSCLGFLRYNFYPAKVFLGDTGSLFIGFTLAALSLSTSSKGPAVAVIGMPLLAVGVPLFDTILAVWRRSIRQFLAGSSLTRSWLTAFKEGDAEHLHHRLLQADRRHSRVAFLLYAATAFLVIVGILISLFNDRAIGILALVFLAGSYTVVRHLMWIELHDTGEAVLKGISFPVRRNRVMLIYLLADLFVLSAALLGSVTILRSCGCQDVPDLRKFLVWLAPMDIGIPFLFLVLFRSYTRVWYLARVSEYMTTGVAVLLGYVVAAALRHVGGGDIQYLLIRYWLMAGFSVPLVVGGRAFGRVALDLAIWLMHGHRLNHPDSAVRTLICGGGWLITLFLRQHSGGESGTEPVEIVGLVDRDEALINHSVHGVRVLGTIANLPRLLREHQIQLLYVIIPLEPDEETHIRTVCAEEGIKMIRWGVQEEAF